MLANDIRNEIYSLTIIQLKTIVVNHYDTSADRILRNNLKIRQSCFLGMITGLLVLNYHFPFTHDDLFYGANKNWEKNNSIIHLFL